MTSVGPSFMLHMILCKVDHLQSFYIPITERKVLILLKLQWLLWVLMQELQVNSHLKHYLLNKEKWVDIYYGDCCGTMGNSASTYPVPATAFTDAGSCWMHQYNPNCPLPLH